MPTRARLWPWILVPFLLAAILLAVAAAVLGGDPFQQFQYAV